MGLVLVLGIIALFLLTAYLLDRRDHARGQTPRQGPRRVSAGYRHMNLDTREARQAAERETE